MISVLTTFAWAFQKSAHGQQSLGTGLPPLSEQLDGFPIPVSEYTGGYLLGVGDVVRVDVFNIPDYSGEFQVLSGGVLNLPVIGTIDVQGLSVQQATAQIEAQIAPYVRRPRVTVSLLDLRPVHVAIAGEVNRPGSYRIGNNSAAQVASEIPTLTEVIGLAGGITQLADIRHIEVQRRLPSPSAHPLSTAPFNPQPFWPSLLAEAEGRVPPARDSFPVEFIAVEFIAVDLWNLLQEGNVDQDILLQDGDRIIIPTATVLSASEVTEIATASFSPDQITVNVVGEVDAPGAIQLPPNAPLNQALLEAGGFNPRARRRSVNLLRLNPDGTVTERSIDVDFSQDINSDANPALRPNDIIVVGRSGLARVGDSLNLVASPFNNVFSIIRRVFDSF
ncbi:MAG: polysaccharide biosynthesis/export family protein [Leptolyngbyaceae cyanobacterium]